tara:strand:+ start:479 stop:835 length:357 start_codon:yes stop_codon:yes gene_type:complete
MARILIAEDELHISKLVEFKLSKEGHEIHVAHDGKEAIESLDSEWDLIILDVMMPHFDGWEVLKRVRENQTTQNIPVLMLTAKGSADLDSAMKLDVTQYLKKPFDPNELASVVSKMIQ